MNKFFQIFGTLSLAERGRLRKFAMSPYFSKNKGLLLFFELLAKNTKNEAKNDTQGDVRYDEKAIFAAVFADEVFETTRYNRLLSDATVLLLRFLETEVLLAQETPFGTAIARLDALQKRQLHRFYAAENEVQRAALLSQPLRNGDFYHQKLAVEKRSLWHSRQENTRTERNNLADLHRELDCFFIVEKLRYTCEVLNGQHILQHQYEIEGIETLLLWLTKSAYLAEAAVQVYFLVYQLLTQQDAASFAKLKTALAAHETRFVPAELKELYIYCTNYCIRQVNNGNEAYLHEYLDIIWRLLQNKVAFVNGELAVADYKNVVTIGLRAGDFDKTEYFVKTYSQYLPLEHRTTAVTFNLAKLYFAKADYPKVIGLLQEMDYENVFYALDGRWLLLKTYYVLGEDFALESAARAFRIYLLRNKTIAAHTKQQYLQLIILLNKIMLIPQKDAMYAQKLREAIAKKPIIADKQWLIARLDALVE